MVDGDGGINVPGISHCPGFQEPDQEAQACSRAWARGGGPRMPGRCLASTRGRSNRRTSWSSTRRADDVFAITAGLPTPSCSPPPHGEPAAAKSANTAPGGMGPRAAVGGPGQHRGGPETRRTVPPRPRAHPGPGMRHDPDRRRTLSPGPTAAILFTCDVASAWHRGT